MLCNNAGLNSARGNAADVSPGDFADVFNVNVVGLYACTHAVLPHMIARTTGGSSTYRQGRPSCVFRGPPRISASKAAVNAMTMTISR